MIDFTAIIEQLSYLARKSLSRKGLANEADDASQELVFRVLKQPSNQRHVIKYTELIRKGGIPPFMRCLLRTIIYEMRTDTPKAVSLEEYR